MWYEMKRSSSVLFAVLALSAALLVACMPKLQPPANEQPKPLQVIWSGTSGGFAIRWTTKEISATANPPAKRRPIVFSDTGLAIVDFSALGSRQSGDCDFQRVSRVLSIVGPLISLEHADELRCGQGGAVTRRTQTVAIDLTNPQRRPALTDLFPDRAVLSALSSAPPLQNTLAALHARAPQSTAAFVHLLVGAPSVCNGKFPQDFLNRFSFARVRGNQVLVWENLPLDCKTNVVSFWLPIPAARSAAFTAAANRKQGFLLGDEASIARGRGTTILYHVRNTSQ